MKQKKNTNQPQNSFPHLILASSSPRRADLLRSANLSVMIRAPEVDERQLRGELPRALVKRLSLKKAEAIANASDLQLSAGVILAADTIVISPGSGQVLGKPTDRKNAIQMLKKLSGRTHTVLTGYCLIGFGLSSEAGKVINRVIQSRVTIRTLSDELIEDYVSTGEPMDKAGSYAAQGLGMCFIEKISGSYTNVVGLPVSHVLDDLEHEFGIRPRF